MTIAVDLGRKATNKQTNKQTNNDAFEFIIMDPYNTGSDISSYRRVFKPTLYLSYGKLSDSCRVTNDIKATSF